MKNHTFTSARAETFSMGQAEFLQAVVDTAGGHSRDVVVGLLEGAGHTATVEVFGPLPTALIKGRMRALAYWEAKKPNSVSWDECWGVWHTTSSGYGPRYALWSLSDLLSLLAERQALVRDI